MDYLLSIPNLNILAPKLKSFEDHDSATLVSDFISDFGEFKIFQLGKIMCALPIF